MLSVIGVGNVGQIKSKTEMGDKLLVKFTVCRNQKRKGENVAHWYDCDWWIRKEYSWKLDNLIPGATVYITGNWNCKSYQARDGQTRRSNTLNIPDSWGVEFPPAGKRPGDNGEPPTDQEQPTPEYKTEESGVLEAPAPRKAPASPPGGYVEPPQIG